MAYVNDTVVDTGKCMYRYLCRIACTPPYRLVHLLSLITNQQYMKNFQFAALGFQTCMFLVSLKENNVTLTIISVAFAAFAVFFILNSNDYLLQGQPIQIFMGNLRQTWPLNHLQGIFQDRRSFPLNLLRIPRRVRKP